MKKHRDIKLVKIERRRNYFVSEPNYHTTEKFFTESLLEIEMKKTEIIMNIPVYLGLSILQLSKILMYEFWYDIVCIKTDDIYKDIAEDVETRFDTSNCELDRLFPNEKDK